MSKSTKTEPKARIRRPLNITVSDEVRAALEHKAESREMSVSKIISALAKVYCAIPVGIDELGVEAELKRAFGREQFLAFLHAVEQCLTPDWKPLAPKHGDTPDTWLNQKRGIGIYAFFACNGDNSGKMLSGALALKSEHILSKVIVCTTDAEAFPPDQRADLAKIGVVILSLGRLAAEIGEKPARKGR